MEYDQSGRSGNHEENGTNHTVSEILDESAGRTISFNVMLHIASVGQFCDEMENL